MHVLLMMSLLFADVEPLPIGKSVVDVQFGEVSIPLYTYKPADYSDGPLLMVFHGVLRNADEYRDDSVEMGNRFGALIVAPKFDDTTFPKRKYQFGGIMREGEAAPPEEWTGEYINRIAKEIRRREARPEMPLYLIGHSGGGQFLMRTTGFVNTGAKRIVAANPGTLLFPNRSAEFPLGFGQLPQHLQSDDQMKAYLAQPLTLYLGSKDIERDEYLDVTPAADVQGLTRFERGQNAFKAAKKLADDRQWPFGWKLVIARDVEHDHTKMFNDPHCADALGLPQKK
ncbi:hypothetical protein [Schlesneria sp.]|uniref:hypothetical protein n=1 Tax=Schlesneria sp. TaxID=2762018 RepID=UPI002EE54C46